MLSQFYYLTWKVSIDNQAADAIPSIPEGLTSVTLPEGVHTLDLSQRETPIQSVANVTSLVGIALSGWLLFQRERNRTDRPALP